MVNSTNYNPIHRQKSESGVGFIVRSLPEFSRFNMYKPVYLLTLTIIQNRKQNSKHKVSVKSCRLWT